ncbi:MAG: hypothetical protein ACR2NO_06370 [Chloroflexota bacterium]
MKTYRESPFAIVALPADADPRAIRSRIQQLSVQARLEGRDDRHIRAAAQTLQDAPARLPLEVFWLWDSGPAVIGALASGDPTLIGQVLASADEDGLGRGVGEHDTAVLAHARALHSDGASDAEREALWRAALDAWRPLLDKGAVVEWLRCRASALDDVRLTAESVQRTAAGVARNVLAGLVDLAQEDADAGNADACLRWCRLIWNWSVVDVAAVEAATDKIADAAAQVVHDTCQRARTALTDEADSGRDSAAAAFEESRATIDLAQDALLLLEQVARDHRAAVERAADEVASTIRGLSVFAHNKLERLEEAADLLELALATVSSRSVLEQISADRIQVREHAFQKAIGGANAAAKGGNLAQARADLERAQRYADTGEQRSQLSRIREALPRLRTEATRAGGGNGVSWKWIVRGAVGLVVALGALSRVGSPAAGTRATPTVATSGSRVGTSDGPRAVAPQTSQQVRPTVAAPRSNPNSARLSSLRSELDSLEDEVERLDRRVRAKQGELESLKADMESTTNLYRLSGAPDWVVRQYEDNRRRYNAGVDEYNAELARYRRQLAEYNEKVDEYNRLVRS